MRKFHNEWIFQTFEDEPTFVVRPMFGGLAAYLFGRLMLVLVEPTTSGRWDWDGVLVCTDASRQEAILAEFPHLDQHKVLRKWLYLDSHAAAFAPTITQIAAAVARNDARFGVQPRPRARRRRTVAE